jgi:serine/threonine-protein kinase RsbW
LPTIRMPAKREYLEEIRSCVMDKVRGLGISQKTLYIIELTLEEILSNIAKYAYPDASGEVEIECLVDETNEVRIVVRDWGAPFNPMLCELPNIHEDVCERPVGGLGVYLVRQLAGELFYQRLSDGNRLTIVFQL